MIKSMTGVGRHEGTLQPWNGRIAVDIRSVNHKFFELVPHLPPALAGHEGEIRELIRHRISRGYVQLHIEVDENADAPVLALHHRTVTDYLRLAREVKDKYGVPGEVNINTLLTYPGIVTAEKSEQNRAKLWHQSRLSIERALGQLLKMKKAEGANLVRDMRKRVTHIRRVVGIIEQRVPVRLRERRDNLLLQLKAMKVEVDPKRILEEVAFITERVDIHEECVRLKSHCSMFLRALSSAQTSGKKLDFITQEMLRETDTIASKARDMVISRRAIEIKGEIEKLKEQVRNVE